MMVYEDQVLEIIQVEPTVPSTSLEPFLLVLSQAVSPQGPEGAQMYETAER